MTNNNNQFNNQSANNNFNTINEETMNYTIRLQNVLAELEVEKQKNQHLHDILAANEMHKESIFRNAEIIRESFEEFETEGDATLVVESQKEAIALIAKIKGLVNPVEAVKEVAEIVEGIPVQEIVEELSEPIKEVSISNSNKSRRRARHIKLKHKGTSSRPYAVASKEGWKEIIGIYIKFG
jgi:hypothetical protein